MYFAYLLHLLVLWLDVLFKFISIKSFKQLFLLNNLL